MLKFDFHCHSCFSDGALTPTQLIDYAVEREIKLLALTDHDCIHGLSEAHNHILEKQYDIELINGVELTALCEFGEVHVVGLGIDSTNTSLLSTLAQQQAERKKRARQIDEKLNLLGVHGVLEYCNQMSPVALTRTHIAQAIVALGYAKDMKAAFKKFLGKNGKIKVAKNWIDLSVAIELIKQAGGVAVLAHPTRYPLSNRKLGLLIAHFAQLGGEAIEMAYPSLSKDKIEWLKLHLEMHQLQASSGSDFHYPGLKWTDLGKFPFLDRSIPHIFEERIQI
ncbi:PHP domain-containing protein [Aliikangiella maris]|uniref:PHP domain-containing protein n=2 Tax=Aliikangiella maris TaxID=3162458 RepID=A0ABV3MII4_9GAMM